MSPNVINLWAVIGALAVIGFAARTIWSWVKTTWPTTIVYDYQRGLLYRSGSFERVLEAGRHQISRESDAIEIVDMRQLLLTIGGQEVLTADTLVVKLTATLRIKVRDPRAAFETSQRASDIIHSETQLALRRAAGRRTLEQLLAEKGEVAKELATDLAPVLESVGQTLVQADIRDCMLTSETKRAFADQFRARKEGEAALERARSETAALRSLANAARMLKDNPGLLDLRMLQALQVGAQKGATVILNTAREGGRVVPIDADGTPTPQG